MKDVKDNFFRLRNPELTHSVHTHPWSAARYVRGVFDRDLRSISETMWWRFRTRVKLVMKGEL